jgi:hypothetical protein
MRLAVAHGQGQVVAGAAWISPDVVADLPQGLTDSKKLTASRRQNMYDDLLELAKEQRISATGNRPQQMRLILMIWASYPRRFKPCRKHQINYYAICHRLRHLAGGYRSCDVTGGRVNPPGFVITRQKQHK